MDELIDIFLADSPARLDAIRLAVQEKDSSTLEYNSHALKGSCTIIGAKTMSGICYEMEKMGGKSELADSKNALNRLEEEFIRAQKDLSNKPWVDS